MRNLPRASHKKARLNVPHRRTFTCILVFFVHPAGTFDIYPELLTYRRYLFEAIFKTFQLMADNKHPPPGGNGGPNKLPVPGTCSDDADGKSDSRRRRRRNTNEAQEEETKEEIESLAAASGFNVSSGSNAAARNNNMSARVVSLPGAYAVDGPDHGSVSTDGHSRANMSAAQSV